MKAKMTSMLAITTTIILLLANKYFAAAAEEQEQKYKVHYPSLSNISWLISNTEFNRMLKNRNDGACPARRFYTYEAFISAAISFPDFATVGDIATRKREIAAFLAQTSHETSGGWATAPDGPYTWGYCIKKEQSSTLNYCVPSTKWPCMPGRKYYGRGPIQMTYNYNYGLAGKALGIDLLKNPDYVETNPTLSFLTSLWVWMTPQPGKPSCHSVITGLWKPTSADLAANRVPGYGVITNIINGDIECGHGPDHRVQNRIGFYNKYTTLLGVSPGSNLHCGNQKAFGRV